MKNILAENMLRFGSKNLDSKTIKKLQRLVEQAPAGPKIATINYKQTYNLKAGDSNPASYIGEMLKGVLAAINANADAKNMLTNKSIKLVRAIFQGGASNSWAGQATGFDLELDNKTKSTPTETELYQKNKDLAAKRAAACKDALLPLLQKQGIKLATNLPAATSIASAVFNTGGKIDLQGQIIRVTLYFSYLETSDLTDLQTIRASFILTGTYSAKDGKSSGGTSNLAVSDPKSYTASTGKLPANLKTTPNRLAAFEVKWNPNVLSNPTKIPWYRWLFIYNEQGKIERIEGQVYDKTLNASLQNFFKPNTNIAPTDPTLQYMINLNNPNNYNTFIKPFI